MREMDAYVLSLIPSVNYPDISNSVPDICEMYPVSFLMKFCEKSPRHRGFHYEPTSKSREIAKNPCKVPCYQRIANGDRFVSDCAHHHPVSANHRFPS